MRLKGITVAVLALAATVAVAQNPQMEEKLMAIKQNMAKNKQQLAMYTYTQVETISLKGDVKDTRTYQVSTVNGQQQKTEINDQKASSGGGREGRLKKHVVEKKTDEYKEYGQQIGQLVKQYTVPDPERLMQAKQQGNLSIVPGNRHHEPGHQELREAERPGHIRDQRSEQGSGQHSGQFLPERSQRRGDRRSTIRATTGWYESRHLGHHQWGAKAPDHSRPELELPEDHVISALF